MWNLVFTVQGRADFFNFNVCPLAAGVDFFISDKPLEAMQFRDSLALGYNYDD